VNAQGSAGEDGAGGVVAGRDDNVVVMGEPAIGDGVSGQCQPSRKLGPGDCRRFEAAPSKLKRLRLTDRNT
jgi:hypothetical protein